MPMVAKKFVRWWSVDFQSHFPDDARRSNPTPTLLTPKIALLVSHEELECSRMAKVDRELSFIVACYPHRPLLQRPRVKREPRLECPSHITWVTDLPAMKRRQKHAC